MKIATSATEDEITKLVNEYFYTTNCTITDDNKIFNSKLDKIVDGFDITIKRGRWIFSNNV